jgi:hypothetical protein
LPAAIIVKPALSLRELAFEGDALMFLAGTLDSVLELAAIVGELIGHFVDPARHIAIDCGPKHHGFTDPEFV